MSGIDFTKDDLRREMQLVLAEIAGLVELAGHKNERYQLTSASDWGSLNMINVENFDVWHYAEDIYDLCTDPKPDGFPGGGPLGQLGRFIESLPQLSPNKLAESYRPKSGCLLRLATVASARSDLWHYLYGPGPSPVGSPKEDIEIGAPLTVRQLASLANIAETSLRNELARRKLSCVRLRPEEAEYRFKFEFSEHFSDSVSEAGKNRRLYVGIQAKEAIRWLAGRRGYVPTPLEAGTWFDPKRLEHARQIANRSFGWYANIFIWNNIGTTEHAARKLGWAIPELERCFDDQFPRSPTKLAQLAEFLGITEKKFRNGMDQLRK